MKPDISHDFGFPAHLREVVKNIHIDISADKIIHKFQDLFLFPAIFRIFEVLQKMASRSMPTVNDDLFGTDSFHQGPGIRNYSLRIEKKGAS